MQTMTRPRIIIRKGKDIPRVFARYYITQNEFAKMVGITPRDLRKMINGELVFGRLMQMRLQAAADSLAENPPKIPVKSYAEIAG